MPASHYQWLDRVPDLVGLSAANPREFPFLLDNAAGPGCSLLLYAGQELLVQHSDGRITGPVEGENSSGNFFERLDRWYQAEKDPRATPRVPEAAEIPFSGGWFVYLGYEMAATIEPTLRLPVNDSGLPDALAQRCPGAVLVFDSRSEAAPEPRLRALAIAETADVLARILSLAADNPPAVQGAIPTLQELHEDPPARFEAGVSAVLDYLAAGDVFQVNISRPWRARFVDRPDPAVLYNSLRRRNPAPFAGMLRWQDVSLLSSSPERLVQVRGRDVQTRPIAGTRPRGQDPQQDALLARELMDNPKEQAEHVMLIDLERNDLGRVCAPGSVEVNEFMVIESYAHVHHIVSNVRGRLREEAGPVQAMQAVFPGGTITGCPKVRCMEIIAEFEQQGRGFYTGSMGYLDRSGSLDMNILIRSMLLSDREIRFRTGAGIVADSVPSRELQETADKARGLLLALHPEPAMVEDA